MSFMIVFIPVALPAAWLIDTRGFRLAVGLGVVLMMSPLPGRRDRWRERRKGEEGEVGPFGAGRPLEKEIDEPCRAPALAHPGLHGVLSARRRCLPDRTPPPTTP
jgi:hypothetical protein